jgi:hypothetical protein
MLFVGAKTIDELIEIGARKYGLNLTGGKGNNWG